MKNFFFFETQNSEMRAEYSLHLTLIIPTAFLAPAFSRQKLQMCPTYLNSSTEVPACLAWSTQVAASA